MLIAASCGALAGCEVSPGLAPSDRVAQNMDKMTKNDKNIWMLFSGKHKQGVDGGCGGNLPP